MLWKYSLQFSGLFDAPNSLCDARRLLIERIKADPSAFICKIEPAEQVCPSLLRRVVGL
jgi:hypothetical protein